jgi:hypothetical protein
MKQNTNQTDTRGNELGPVLYAGLLSVDEIMKIRNKLPDNWKWSKVYELPYVSSKTGRQIVLKHWALTPPDEKGLVCSLGLISHDYTSTRAKFMEDEAVQFVEQSLIIIDSLLAEISRLKACR